MRETEKGRNEGRALLRGPDWDEVGTSKGIPTLGRSGRLRAERYASAWTVRAQPDTDSPPHDEMTVLGACHSSLSLLPSFVEGRCTECAGSLRVCASRDQDRPARE
jgi:hypothetical protein